MKCENATDMMHGLNSPGSQGDVGPVEESQVLLNQAEESLAVEG